MNCELKQEYFNVADMKVIIKRKPIKNMYLRIDQDSLQAIVSAPLLMPVAQIESFVLGRAGWLQQKLAFLAKRQLVFSVQEDAANQLWLWGKRYAVRIVPGKEDTLLRENEIIFSGITGENCSAKLLKRIDKLYRQQLEQRIADMAAMWQQRLRLTASGWRIRRMKTRWGTCNTGSKIITINYNLVRMPAQCLEYIIVHELAHLYEPSHNGRFKNFLTNNLPDWKKREVLLKHFTF